MCGVAYTSKVIEIAASLDKKRDADIPMHGKKVCMIFKAKKTDKK